MIQTKIISRINFPEITLQEDLERIAKNIIIPDIIMGIERGMAITGGALPPNEPATIKRKGHDRQLIETGKLRSSFYHRLMGKNKVIISISGDRKEIGGHLQIEGIKAKGGMKFYRFFGMSRDAADASILFIKNKIGELTHGSRGK